MRNDSPSNSCTSAVMLRGTFHRAMSAGSMRAAYTRERGAFRCRWAFVVDINS